MLSEKDAKDRWCPQARALQGDVSQNDANKWVLRQGWPASYNRVRSGMSKDLALVKCIGSGCMAWRWASEPPINESFEVECGTDRDRKGYCGAYGKPEFE